MKIAKAIRNYAKPRIQPEKGVDTSGDAPELRPGLGVLAGAMQGYMTGKRPTGDVRIGVATGLGGVVGAYTGGKVAEKNGMFAGATTGFGVGAMTTAAVTSGILALTQGSFHPGFVALTALGGGLAGLSGTLASTAGGSGVLAGGTQGLLVDNTSGLAAGSLGSYVGIEVGKKTESSLKALGAGTLAGSLIGAGSTAALAAAFGSTPSLGLLVSSAVLGGFSAAVGTMGGSRRAAPRDAAYGGMLTGMMAGAYLQNPALAAGTAAASTFSTLTKDSKSKAVFGAVGGAVAGAIAGGLSGPSGIVSGAIAGAVAAPVGAFLGTSARQVMRNAQHDLVTTVNDKWVNPYLEKNKLSHGQKLAVGGAAFGVIGAPIGLGLEGAAGGLVVGGLATLAGVAYTHRLVGQVKKSRQIQAALPQYDRPEDMFERVLAAQEKILNSY